MKERGMIFNGEMTRAILDGRKTQTRRIVKGTDGAVKFCKEWDINGEEIFVVLGEKDHTGMNPVLGATTCPFGAVGDRLIPAMPIPSLGKRYCADVFGCIWSKAKSGGEWRKLKGSANGKGYLTITPAVSGKYKTRLVHELVAEAFYGKRPSGSQIRHLDGNQKNNSPENLDYGTQEQNWSDRLVNGVSLGEDHHNAKITNKIANEIRASSLSQRALSKLYELSQSTIWSIKNNRTWVEHPIPKKPNMPRWASRILLEITDVRVERLNAISPEDAESEGLERTNFTGFGDEPGLPSYPEPDVYFDPLKKQWKEYPPEAFAGLWESIYGEGSWQANPWVWVIEFKRVEGGAA